MNKDLIYIIEQRNVLAHRVLNMDEVALSDDEGITFLTFKNELSGVRFTEQTFMELKEMIQKLTKYFFGKRNSQ